MTKLVQNSGQIVDLLNPDPNTIKVRDIAHNLARINRFNGATNFPYSVAQHSIYVSHIVPKEFAFVGLLHDAPEAYLGDIVSPLKQLLPEYRKLEDNMWAVMARIFDIPFSIPREVHIADMRAYKKERITLIDSPMSGDPDSQVFVDLEEPERELERGRCPANVEAKFINRYMDLLRERIV